MRGRIAGWMVLLAAAGAAALWAPLAPDESVAVVEPPATVKLAANTGTATLAALPAREPLGPARGELFASPSPPPRPIVAAQAPAAPAVPPMPYRVAGQVTHDGDAHVVLARGDEVLVVSEGESLEGGYRVESIGSDGVTLLYEPLGIRDRLPVVGAELAPANSASAESQPAQLRWEGPERVRAGATFDVALKLNSGEPLRATPLQLNFDAALLEPVQVRAGRYFSGGTFSYRVNPAGSIFIGASGKGADASDAELLILSFRPIRPGVTAELKLSSVLLQGNAGRAIAHDQPAAFRTAIVQ